MTEIARRMVEHARRLERFRGKEAPYFGHYYDAAHTRAKTIVLSRLNLARDEKQILGLFLGESHMKPYPMPKTIYHAYELAKKVGTEKASGILTRLALESQGLIKDYYEEMASMPKEKRPVATKDMYANPLVLFSQNSLYFQMMLKTHENAKAFLRDADRHLSKEQSAELHEFFAKHHGKPSK